MKIEITKKGVLIVLLLITIGYVVAQGARQSHPFSEIDGIIPESKLPVIPDSKIPSSITRDSELTSAIASGSVNYANSAGNADTVDGFDAATTGSGSFIPVTTNGKLDPSVIPFETIENECKVIRGDCPADTNAIEFVTSDYYLNICCPPQSPSSAPHCTQVCSATGGTCAQGETDVNCVGGTYLDCSNTNHAACWCDGWSQSSVTINGYDYRNVRRNCFQRQ